MAKFDHFVVVSVVQGEVVASVIKSHLESEGIPALLRYESAGLVYGLTVDGLGMVKVLVPARLADDARKVISVRDRPSETVGPCE